MRKMSVLLCVLGIACTANAGLFISVNGDSSGSDFMLAPSDHAVIGVTGDGLTNPPVGAWLIVEGPGTISGGAAGAGKIYTHVPGSGDGFEQYKAWMEDLGYANINGLSLVEFSSGVLDGELVGEIVFEHTAAEDVVVSLMHSTMVPGAPAYDTLIIHDVPEPMTIVLIGFGAMFLRRR